MGIQSDRDDRDAVRRACSRWLNGSTVTPYDMFMFADWLGDPISYDTNHESWNRLDIIDMSKPEIRRKIELINNNDHWRTLLKVMEIRRGET